ncbi:MAG: hypothetical protein ACRCTD_16410 [Beijerinckiaceae bacterium]
MQTITEVILLGMATCLALLVTAWCARLPARKSLGLLAGVAAGTITTVVLNAAVGFARYILPFNQVDFWLAAQLAKLGL